MTKRPNSRVNLDKAIERIFGNYEKSLETRSIMANAIAGQMLNGAVVKGGSSLKLRYGISCTRATMDLDTACKDDIALFIADLSERMRAGWNDFTGEVVRRNPAAPRLLPQQSVMKPYAVRLMYKGQSWPPTVSIGENWESLYNAANAKGGTGRSLQEAIAWANNLIATIDNAKS